jgi:hypothetical protein
LAVYVAYSDEAAIAERSFTASRLGSRRKHRKGYRLGLAVDILDHASRLEDLSPAFALQRHPITGFETCRVAGQCVDPLVSIVCQTSGSNTVGNGSDLMLFVKDDELFRQPRRR